MTKQQRINVAPEDYEEVIEEKWGAFSIYSCVAI